jgi:glycolate oxidase FAD binding subunit
LTIDGVIASSVCRPSDVRELSEVMVSLKGTVVPVGAGTQQHFGNCLRSADCAVDLTRLNRITEYVPADLTVHVETGVRLADVQTALAENGQFLPLDPWNGPAATVGGIAAVNAQGAYRATGTIRDWIIGMKVIEADGTISRTGGRVVKNVTGYDLAKLYTGSIGTLAIIAEISLKVRSAYGAVVTAIAHAADLDDAGRLLSSIR